MTTNDGVDTLDMAAVCRVTRERRLRIDDASGWNGTGYVFMKSPDKPATRHLLFESLSWGAERRIGVPDSAWTQGLPRSACCYVLNPDPQCPPIAGTTRMDPSPYGWCSFKTHLPNWAVQKRTLLLRRKQGEAH